MKHSNPGVPTFEWYRTKVFKMSHRQFSIKLGFCRNSYQRYVTGINKTREITLEKMVMRLNELLADLKKPLVPVNRIIKARGGEE